MDENFKFQIKSGWLDDGLIRRVGVDCFFLYLNIRKFELRRMKNIGCVSVELLFEEMKRYPVANGRKYTRPDIKNKLLSLKSKGLIDFNRRIENMNDLLWVTFLDLPQLDEKFKPETEDDHFVIVETGMMDLMMECGLKEVHFILYLYLKKFNEMSMPSYQRIGRILGVNKNTANIYGRQLEECKIIANVKSVRSNGREHNQFIVPGYDEYDQFLRRMDEHFIRVDVGRIKNKLKKNGIKVTKRALDDVRDWIDELSGEEKVKLDELCDRHIVFGIEYVYFELMDEYKMRKDG